MERKRAASARAAILIDSAANYAVASCHWRLDNFQPDGRTSNFVARRTVLWPPTTTATTTTSLPGANSSLKFINLPLGESFFHDTCCSGCLLDETAHMSASSHNLDCVVVVVVDAPPWWCLGTPNTPTAVQNKPNHSVRLIRPPRIHYLSAVVSCRRLCPTSTAGCKMKAMSGHLREYLANLRPPAGRLTQTKSLRRG